VITFPASLNLARVTYPDTAPCIFSEEGDHQISLHWLPEPTEQIGNRKHAYHN
jgi:hypothetical protein